VPDEASVDDVVGTDPNAFSTGKTMARRDPRFI
jgi:hypothetical protein